MREIPYFFCEGEGSAWVGAREIPYIFLKAQTAILEGGAE